MKRSEDPVIQTLSQYTLPEILEQAPPIRGFAVEGGDDAVTVDEVTRAWNEYKSSF